MRHHTLRAVCALSATALLLAGCAGTSHPAGTVTVTSSASAATDHNQADAMFSMMMVPHHAQAVEMADLVPSRTQNAELRSLAEKIKAAQQPEIDQMTAWLAGWGMKPMTDMDEHAGHMGMDGMMSAEDMTTLAGLKDAPFDTKWLTMMIAHHEGAVDMAKEVLSDGSHAPTKALAQAIITGQQAEITQMKAMLAG